jgi:hypothetical protein
MSKLKTPLALAAIFILFWALAIQGTESPDKAPISASTSSITDSTGKQILTRFNPPEGYSRSKLERGEFGYFLRQLPLKPVNSPVLYYDGSTKPLSAYVAVVDLPIGKRDLHQCADAVMRLRADFLRSEKLYDEIHFNFTNGFNCEYKRWRKGDRVKISGNKVEWVRSAQASDDYAVYWKYLEIVFSYAGTLSLSKELNAVDYTDMKTGDVFIKGGSPGHAVIVVDMALDTLSGKKLYILAQSYMPAQEIQILRNPSNHSISPWYELTDLSNIITPEWIFDKSQLKRF